LAKKGEDKMYEYPIDSFKPKYTKTKKIEANPQILRQNKILTVEGILPITEEFKIIKTHLLKQCREKNIKTLLITSPSKEEGKSFVALNLAIVFACELDQTVLLVDADLKKSSIPKMLGIEVNKGLADYLLYNTPLEELLIWTGIEKLVFLPAGRSLLNSAELLGSSKSRKLIEEMRNRYEDRFIIFDSPPLLSVADAVVLSDLVDGIVLVVEAEKTKREDLNLALEFLKGKNVLGIVLNKVRESTNYAKYYNLYKG